MKTELLLPEGSQVPYAIFDNVISDELLSLAQDEINYLDRFITMTPQQAGSAFTGQGEILKKNTSLWLHDFYNNRKYSPILSSIDKLLHQESVDSLIEYNNIYSYLPALLDQGTSNPLLSRYGDGDYYKPHNDKCIYSMCFHIWNDPKDFDGGEFYFYLPNGDIENIETKPNRAILFPSYYYHGVTPIKYHSESSAPRYSVNMFWNFIN